MESVRATLPDRPALDVAVRAALTDATWGELTVLLTPSFSSAQQRGRGAALLAVAGVLTLLAAFLAPAGVAGVLFGGAVVFSGATVVVLVRYLTARRCFAHALNRSLLPHAFLALGLPVDHRSGSDTPEPFFRWPGRSLATAKADPDYQALIEALDASELLTATVHEHTVDDVFHTTFLDQPLTVGELRSTRTQSNGKQQYTVVVFHGFFVSYRLPVTLEGVTFVSTEGDEHGFGHRDFWSQVVGKTAVEETVLEWNEFERVLHVATSDGAEARYILTPDFMADLYAWWGEDQRNLRIAFRGDHLSLLFPDTRARIGGAPLTLDRDRLHAYLMTIVVPLWRTLLLLEDVRTRFR